MQLNHVNGQSVETNDLNDLDAHLMEESSKLHKLFKKYNRQLMLIGEMQAVKDQSTERGCTFFHISSDTCTPEKAYENFMRVIGRMDQSLQTMTKGQMFIAALQPPQEDK